MASNSFLSACLILFVSLYCITHAQVSTPEPEPEPLRPTIPKLFLSTAGSPPFTENSLTPFRSYDICPDDYETGFSIRCEVENAKTVFWRVNGVLFKKEYFAPYYLSGNWKDRIGAYKGLEVFDRIRVACRVPTRKPVWVDIIKKC